ncbi:Six-hairpin glycosidase-like protein [Lyophyllum atratum]|nr:Six-hairpin glycosidase-like protein [Lyophyllum atratum]
MSTTRCSHTFLTYCAFFVLLFPIVSTQNLTSAQLGQVSARLAESAKLSHSWELGTRAQAIISLNATAYSALSPKTPLPPPSSVPDNLSSALEPVFAIAQTTVAGRASSNKNITGPQPLMQDGSAADPASIGFAVVLANWTKQSGGDYAGAAKDQMDFLQFQVPRTSDGAISHRVSQVQLWSDFVYMVPPFFAYYGVITQNRTLLVQAHDQIKLYRSYLRDASAGNLWKHVLLGMSDNDEGHWSTGNAWAAAGMLRVLGTIQNSQYANTLKNEQNDLATWIKEIHGGMYPHLDSQSSLFPNYASQPPTAPGNFLDAASTALLASTVYRFSLLWGDHSHLPVAERSRKALFASTSAPNMSLAHIDANGWLTPVVNPHAYREQGQESAEGQAFVVELEAAWRDWVADGAKGANGAVRVRGEVGLRGWMSVALGTFSGMLLV